jgi:hypothetical protein
VFYLCLLRDAVFEKGGEVMRKDLKRLDIDESWVGQLEHNTNLPAGHEITILTNDILIHGPRHRVCRRSRAVLYAARCASLRIMAGWGGA